MNKCTACLAEYDESLRRCPRCGEYQHGHDEMASGELGPAGLPGDVVPLRKTSLSRKKSLLLIGVAVLLGVGTVMLTLGFPGAGSDTQITQPHRRHGTGARTPKRGPRVPTALVAGELLEGFDVTAMKWTGEGLLIEGAVSPHSAVGVLVNGDPAVLSPEGNRFWAVVPRPKSDLEVIVLGVDGTTASKLAAPPIHPGEIPEEYAQVVGLVEGQSLHKPIVRVRWSSPKLRRGLRIESVALPALRNRIQRPGLNLTLYRTPKGLVVLRINPQGHYTFLRVKDGVEMVLVPAGLARRGRGQEAPDGPEHLMFTRAFYIDRTEVTNRQYAAFLQFANRRGGSASARTQVFRHPEDPGVDLKPVSWVAAVPRPGTEDLPVVGISWYAAFAYAKWVGGRLPKEAEWERAAAGPEGLTYPWGDEMWVDRCRHNASGPLPAASLLEGQSPSGVLNMSGNVREWCGDRYDPRWLRRSSRVNPSGPPLGRHVVVRGGSFKTPLEDLALQARRHEAREYVADDLGFRVARGWQPPKPGKK
ncbi:MAG: SUMF1/EgtB/PvdO family nonheme iron enzyme [Planctomycetota bacterium]|nr:SUMF1/EgtB/PvdO family nonheme iron enzyme [Planctomycetota bacterium]